MSIPETLHFENLSRDLRHLWESSPETLRRYRRMGFRPPRKGEWFVSGAIPAAYRALGDLTNAYHIVEPISDDYWKP